MKGGAVLRLMHGNESLTGRLQSERKKGIGDANVPPGASDLDYAQLPLRWLAHRDVASS